ncbi:HPF/RaiA family ribosome-associated protein [Pokkaliibacter sp. CJK22405]|uniref:HPF/RaiA family ribosome-associated protein n=1 Tax=Pokkaliibacter sp. CJK22405 TaxID=3384615 RepID=UPI00398554F6
MMQVRISNLNDAKLSTAVRERLMQKLIQHTGLEDHILDLHVTLTQDGRMTCIEAKLQSDQGRYFAKASGENLYQAIDHLGEKVRKQAEKKRRLVEPKRACGMKRVPVPDMTPAISAVAIN